MDMAFLWVPAFGLLTRLSRFLARLACCLDLLRGFDVLRGFWTRENGETRRERVLRRVFRRFREWLWVGLPLLRWLLGEFFLDTTYDLSLDLCYLTIFPILPIPGLENLPFA